MASPFVHTLLPWDTYAAGANETEGDAQQTVGRSRWTYTLDVADGVTSVTVVIQAAPVDEDDEYVTLGTFESGAITTAGSYTLVAPTDFTVQPYHAYHRAKVAAQTGDAAIRVTARGAFIDPDVGADADMLDQAYRTGRDKYLIAEQAERDVRKLLLSNDAAEAAWGVLDLHGSAAWAYDEVRAMVAEQADWLYRRRVLARSRDAGSVEELEAMPDLVPNLADRARALRPKSSAYWRGR